MKYLSLWIVFLLCWPQAAFSQSAPAQTNPKQQTVILLHGLARSPASMNPLQEVLEGENFRTCNIGYPSTQHSLAILASEHVLPAIQACLGESDMPPHFVTHSMGGILVRYLARHRLVDPIGRVVMLGPPNQGSEVVDALGQTWFFEWINGPAGKELGTDSSSVPLQLGAATFQAGIIAGSRSLNPFLSWLIEGEDDGKVSIEKARLEGMTDFVVLPVTHTFIMRDRAVQAQTIHFLRHGTFQSTTQR